MPESHTIGDTTQVAPWQGIVERAASDSNMASLAARLRLPEETLRGQHRHGRSPDFDRVCELFKKMPAAMQDDLLAVLTRGTDVRFHREEGEQESTSRPDLMGMAIQMDRAGCDLMGLIHAAVADGRIDGEEVAKIEAGANAGRREIDRIASTAAALHRRGCFGGRSDGAQRWR